LQFHPRPFALTDRELRRQGRESSTSTKKQAESP
jgi:hypothetical protein